MGFQLVIAAGKEAGREFVFDQASVLIGRTAECDVILYEPGVSRRHARIFTEADSIFVEDMGSSNGTQVNGSKVRRQALKDGDSISLGPVAFTFSRVEDDVGDEPVPLGEGGSNHTRIVDASELQRSRNKGVAMLPKGAGREELKAMGRASTQTLPAMRGQRTTGSNRAVRGSNPTAPRGGDGLARRGNFELEVENDDPYATNKIARPARPPADEGQKLSAAERARIRRQAGASAGAQIWWAEASEKRRRLVLIIAGAVALVFVGVLVAMAMPNDKVKHKKEPTELSTEPIQETFGLGDGVTFTRPDQKTFEFSVNTPVRALVILHYQSKDISDKEVSVTVNGVEVGWLPPDTMIANEVSHEILVPANLINRNESNAVTFDNVKNPPEEDTWRIWNVWVEIAVLPEKSEEGLKADALELFKKAEQKWEQRDIGAGNRWEAYKSYREAWLTLEAIPEADRPPMYLLARDRMNEVRKDLDRMCNKLLLEARTAYSQNKYDETRLTLDHISDFFPQRAHPCQYRAEVDRYEYGL